MKITKNSFVAGIVGLVACISAMAGCHSISGARQSKVDTQKPQQNNLVVDVDKKRLISRLNPPKELNTINVSSGNMDWNSPQHSGISIHLYPSVEAAAHHYHKSSRFRSHTALPNTPKGIGDQLLCFGRVKNPDSSGLIFMRRWNIIIETRWKGDNKSAAAFAKKLDHLILHDSDTFPKGKSIITKNTN